MLGCTTNNPDQISMLLLNNRIKQLEETKKLQEQKVLVEVEVKNISESDIVNLSKNTRKITIEAILDEEGRLIIPPDRIIRKYELKLDR